MPTTPDRWKLTVAAVLLTEDGWTDQQISDYLEISRRTLARWKEREDVSLAMAACRMLQSRNFNRRAASAGHRYVWMEKWHGPKSPLGSPMLE